jgi:hypothetical protein
MKTKLLIVVLFAFQLAALADSADTIGQKKSIAAIAVNSNAFRKQISLQLEAGTQGAGLDFRYGLLSRLSTRVGASFIPLRADNVLALPGFQSTNNASVIFYNAHILADIVPFKNMRGLRIVAGGAYLYKAQGGLSISPTGSYHYGNTTVTGADIGSISMDVSWQGAAPYVGLGLFKSFPSHFFNFNLDLGTYYLNPPKTHIVGTGLLTENYKLEPQFNENLKDYRWLPVVQLNFNFKLK